MHPSHSVLPMLRLKYTAASRMSPCKHFTASLMTSYDTVISCIIVNRGKTNLAMFDVQDVKNTYKF
jgi:hypothetical protein